ncbi:MAG: hypothetical protein M0042_16210, partial [Nitrospiraceae bacterium]|nr:hypothetical protein [Nitrospiraceae bacterium]
MISIHLRKQLNNKWRILYGIFCLRTFITMNLQDYERTARLSQSCKCFLLALFRKNNHLHFGTEAAIYRAREHEEAPQGEKREETTMKNTTAKKGAYLGAGAGLVLFAIFG